MLKTFLEFHKIHRQKMISSSRYFQYLQYSGKGWVYREGFVDIIMLIFIYC